MRSIFEFEDYRAYLDLRLPTKGEGRGQRSKLASILGCQNGFVSFAIRGGTDFSLEHGVLISRFLGHTEEEEDYFLTLLHLARAGSKELKRYYQKKAATVRDRRREISERIQVKSQPSEDDQRTYYSAWYYQAVHMCLFIPKMNRPEAIAKRLGVSVELVNRVLQFLVQARFVHEENGSFHATPSRTHLPADSPLVNKHHTNWRMKAIQALDQSHSTNLHYSGVFSISETAAERMREILLKALSEMEPDIKAAKDETLYVLGLDLFQLR